jgi:hypothetical protein
VRVLPKLVRASASRIENRYVRLVRSVFLDPAVSEAAGREAHLQLILEEQRLSMVQTFKVRADGRGVYLVRDTRGVDCVLKTWYTPGGLDRGLAYMYRADGVRESGYGLFPRVFEARPGHTLEAYIEGPLLRYCPANEVDEQGVRDFLSALKSWSRGFSERHTVLPGEYLEPFEIAERCRDMILRAFRHSQYRARKHIPRYLYLFYDRKEMLRSSISDLMAMSDRVRIPRYVTCGDVHPANIIVDRESGNFTIVDYEEMNDGHYGFDLANLSSQVYRLGLTSRISNTLSSHLADVDYMEQEDVSLFFRKLDRILKEILGVIFEGAIGDNNGDRRQ